MKIDNYCRFSVRGFPDDVEKNRTIEFVASDNSRDSYRTVIPVDKWDLSRYEKNGVVTYQHNAFSSDPDMVIGRGAARIEDDKLIVAIEFEDADLNPLADKIFRKVLAGTINAVSVYFNPTKRGYWGTGEEAENGSNPTYYFDGQELFEVAVVVLPGNPNSTKRSITEFGEGLLGEIHEALGGKYRNAEIEGMKVSEILDLLGSKRSTKVESTINDLSGVDGFISLAEAALAMSRY
ncbi:HK97 family phage prohead protease [Butyricimonas synergistica]|uniref:HK97 family phage prohead protease n=1 Tax=Butyricimonas synergistica TaxID=544644 RepID=UPI0022DFCF2F|nr:HK97 family phage prohead protease [Butyricimonas synergistica]